VVGERQHRRTLGESAHGGIGTDADADIGRAGDHHLHGLAGPLRIEQVKCEPVLLEKAHALAEFGRGVCPIAVLADGDLEGVVGARRRKCRDERDRGGKDCQAGFRCHRFTPSFCATLLCRL
jgi:hypothetical protein